MNGVNLNKTNALDKIPELLACPACRNKTLDFSENLTTLICTHCGNSYPVHDGIPDFLHGKDYTENSPTDIHHYFGTSFDYSTHYSKDAEEFDYFQKKPGGTAHSERRVREYITGMLKGRAGLILDVGCGNAWVANVFCKKGFKVVSLDLSHLNVKKALEKINHENHLGIVADAFSLPFTENSLDYVVASEVIEHVTDPVKFAEGLFRVIKPGGSLIITTPYKEKIVYTLCVHCNRMTPLHAHLHSFDKNKLQHLIADQNLYDLRTFRFGNKVLIHLRTHVLLKYLPFILWRIIDKTADLIYHSPSTIMGVWKKKTT